MLAHFCHDESVLLHMTNKIVTCRNYKSYFNYVMKISLLYISSKGDKILRERESEQKTLSVIGNKESWSRGCGLGCSGNARTALFWDSDISVRASTGSVLLLSGFGAMQLLRGMAIMKWQWWRS